MADVRGWKVTIALFGALVLGCGTEGDGSASPSSELAVQEDGWLDRAEWVDGDGQRQFLAELSRARPTEPLLNPPMRGIPNETADTGPKAVRVGERVFSLSAIRGLIVMDVSDPDALRLEATFPLPGVPVGLDVRAGIARVLFVHAHVCPGALSDCLPSGVLLLDVREPANPRPLAEHRFTGTILGSRELEARSYVLSIEYDVVGNPLYDGERTGKSTLRVFDRSDAATLRDPVVVELPGGAWFGAERLYVMADSGKPSGDAASSQIVLRVANLAGNPAASLSAPIALAGRVSQVLESGNRFHVKELVGDDLFFETFEIDGVPRA